MTKMVWLVAAIAILGAPAYGQTPAPAMKPRADAVDCARFVMSPPQYDSQIQGHPAAESNHERRFICRAAVDIRAQLALASLAQRKSPDPAVRAFAATVLDEEQPLSRQLDDIAVQQDGITPPHGLDRVALGQRHRLARLSGSAFDRVYLRDAMEDAHRTVAALEQGAALPQPFLSRFARNAVAAFEQRVSEAQHLLRRAA